MAVVSETPLPEDALLQRYRQSGDFVDCFTASLARQVALEDFIRAFYASPVFWAERQGLKLLNAHPGDTQRIAALAAGAVDTFSVWSVEERTASQLLMCDINGQTRSWLMVDPQDAEVTQLYFGSAVIKQAGSDAAPKIPRSFKVLMPFHRAYSKVLLGAAIKSLEASR